jgi:hypothetical protein
MVMSIFLASARSMDLQDESDEVNPTLQVTDELW